MLDREIHGGRVRWQRRRINIHVKMVQDGARW